MLSLENIGIGKSKDKKENENENDETLMSSKDGNKNILLECMGDVDDNLFKKYSDSKNFNSFINKFDRATNEEDKEKVVEKNKRHK